MAFKGIDVRETGDRVLFRALLQDSVGALVPSGTASLRLFELQSDASLKSYDFSTGGFGTGVLATATRALAQQKGSAGTYDTGIWTAALAPPSGFAFGNIYFAQVSHTGAMPPVQTREFQYGDAEGGGLASYADAELLRDWTAVTGVVPARCSLNAQRFLRNFWQVSPDGTLSVKKEDDSTEAWSAVVASSGDAAPIVGMDPN